MHQFPERLILRDTKVIADEGQRIYTTATGYGYEKKEYVRADTLVALIEERDRLKVGRDEARLLFDTMASTAEEALAQREAAEAERDALREQIAKLKKDNT